MGFELLKDRGYFKDHGVDVMAFDDIYPEGHQSGISVIMHDKRLLTNGDIRFEQTPGQWQPVSKQDSRELIPEDGTILTKLHYPDENTHLKGINPRIYPDFAFSYEVCVKAEGNGVVVTVNLDREIPPEFTGKLSFNIEIVPGEVFGMSYLADGEAGVFPRQANGPALRLRSNDLYRIDGPISPGEDGIYADADELRGDEESYNPIVADDIIAVPYAQGHHFVLCPEDPLRRVSIKSDQNVWKLYDGRFNHNNGWFVLSAEIPAGKTDQAIVFRIEPNVIRDYEYTPVIQISNVGYHPAQRKIAVIETGAASSIGNNEEIVLYRISEEGEISVGHYPVRTWGNFLRYRYLIADFSDETTQGRYRIRFGNIESQSFQIGTTVYDRGVWQPVIEYFLPVQMCHMRVNEKYRVWHGRCHLDDARMAPVSRNHFDGYAQGHSTLTKYHPGDHVPGLNEGGWHDAGDFDLRIESQSGEAYILALCVEEFDAFNDTTVIDQKTKTVEIHEPDGENDFLQQIEHGLLTVVGGYRSLGRLYRGIICRDLRQYVLLGDPVNMTDGIPGNDDDRLVFTEDNPVHELHTCAHLAAAGRVLKEFRPVLSSEAIKAAIDIYDNVSEKGDGLIDLAEALYQDDAGRSLEAQKVNVMIARIHGASELYLTTGDERYLKDITDAGEVVFSHMQETASEVARVYKYIKDKAFCDVFEKVLYVLRDELIDLCAETPYGVPYRPHIWGAGWGIQAAAMRYYFLYKAFPGIFSPDVLFSSLNFILGTHPGRNNASFASGVGTKSVETAYGINRADWSYIPGGVVSGTALIRPDFPELMEFPYLWQQTEYVLGGGSSHYMFLVLAIQRLLQNGINDND